MKIVNMLKAHYAGSRLYAAGVQYEMEDQLADALIASGDAQEHIEEHADLADAKDARAMEHEGHTERADKED